MANLNLYLSFSNISFPHLPSRAVKSGIMGCGWGREKMVNIMCAAKVLWFRANMEKEKSYYHRVEPCRESGVLPWQYQTPQLYSLCGFKKDLIFLMLHSEIQLNGHSISGELCRQNYGKFLWLLSWFLMKEQSSE